MGGESVSSAFDLVQDRERFVTPAWRRYLELDAAICQYFFTEANGGRPVYLDVEGDELNGCGEQVGLTGAALITELVKEARSLLCLDDTGIPVFREFKRANLAWFRALQEARRTAGERVPPPPTIGLLSLFVIPAEQMGAEGGQGGSHQKYYPRLFELLQIDRANESRFKKSFADESENLWLGLNAWLESEDGRYGLPTAFSLSHRYVGLPVSQALIRETERRQLRRFFAQNGLNPKDPISETEMEELLDSWISRMDTPATRQLQKLWKLQENREQIAAITLNELAVWDGYGFEAFRNSAIRPGSAQKCWLFMVERQTSLFETTTDLGFYVKAGPDFVDEPRQVGGTDINVGPKLKTLREGLLGCTFADAGLNANSVLSGKLVLGDEESGRRRLPRKIIPFEYDAIANIWTEADAVTLGSSYHLLVEEKFLAEAAPVIEAMAGAETKASSLPGIPATWHVYRDVTIFNPPPSQIESSQDYNFSALRSRASKRMALSGGLRLPGRIERYSALAAPRINVVSTDETELRVRIVSKDVMGNDSRLDYWSEKKETPFAISLSEIVADEGDYEILLFDEKTALQSMTLRLRSSAQPDLSGWQSFDDLAHGLPDGLWPFRSLPSRELGDVIAAGAVSFGFETATPSTAPDFLPEFEEATPDEPATGEALIPAVAPDSCLITGAHNSRFPTYDYTEYKRGWVWGECQYCGLTSKAPGNPKFAEKLNDRKKRQRAPVSAATPSSEVHSHRQVETSTQPPTVEMGTDAIGYLGRGSFAALQQIARQIENSAIFTMNFLRSLEELAFIEVTRDEELKPLTFEVAPTAAITTSYDSIVLVGPWVEDNRIAAHEVALSLGGESDRYDTEGFILESISGVTLDAFEQKFGDSVEYVERAGLRLLRALPPLSHACNELSRQPFATTHETEWYDVDGARWRETKESFNLPGAFIRGGRSGRQYFYRFADDVARGVACSADAYSVKHLAAAEQGKTLLKFDSESNFLSVPVGCNLPGLFARAAVLEGGLLPHISSGRLVYQAISEEFAEMIINKLAL